MRQTINLKAPCTPKEIEGKLIHQDLFSCADLLPDQFIDLLIIDPPYHLNKQFGNSKFSKTSSELYEDWLSSWISMLKRAASLYVCCDWQSSNSRVEQEPDYCQMAVKRLNRAESDDTIQGYHNGYFWERNSLADQKQVTTAKKEQKTFAGLLDEQFN